MASHSFLSGQRDLVKVMEKKFQTPSANQSLKSSCTLYRFLIQGFLLFLILLVIHTNQLKAQTAEPTFSLGDLNLPTLPADLDTAQVSELVWLADDGSSHPFDPSLITDDLAGSLDYVATAVCEAQPMIVGSCHEPEYIVGFRINAMAANNSWVYHN